MAVLQSAATIPPGGEGTIEATVATRGRAGPITKSVTVESNDPESPVVRLQLKGTIIVEAGLEPQRLSFGQLSKGERVSKTAVLKAREPGEVRLTEVDVVGATEGLTAKLTKVDGVDAVEVTFDGAKVGRFRGQVKVGTSSSKVPSIDLWVSGEVVGSFELLPRIVSFAEPQEGEGPAKRSIKVRAREGTRFRVTGVRDPEENVSAEIRQDGEMWEILLTLRQVPESRRGTLQILTDDPSEPEIETNYFVRRAGVVRRPPPRPPARPRDPNRPPQ